MMPRKFWILCMALCLLSWHGFFHALPEAAAGASTLKVTRLHIYFGNYRSEITVPQNEDALTAYVELDYSGIGLLQGHWEVDGQVLAQVRRHLDRSNDGAIVLTSPKVPGLPTWQTGGHRLRFVVTEPALAKPEPEALYFVKATKKEATGIRLISPQPMAGIDIKNQLFSWSTTRPDDGYLLVFFDEAGNTVFSVYTKKHEYRIPHFTVDRAFGRGLYQWQVWGYDGSFNKKSGSRRQRFFIKP